MRFRILVHGGRRPLLGYESESRKPNGKRCKSSLLTAAFEFPWPDRSEAHGCW